MTQTTDDLSKGFPMKNNTLDEASMKTLLKAAKNAGINLSGIAIEPLPDGRYLVNHDPKNSTGPADAQ